MWESEAVHSPAGSRGSVLCAGVWSETGSRTGVLHHHLGVYVCVCVCSDRRSFKKHVAFKKPSRLKPDESWLNKCISWLMLQK